MRKGFLKILFLFFTSLCIYNVSAQKKIVFAPHWLAQAQFAGYYMAQEKGFYKDAGLDVEIKPLNLTKNNTKEFLKGKVDIVSLFLDKAVFLAQKENITNICQTSQNSSLVLVANKKIKDLQDLNGKKIGQWRGNFGIEFLRVLNKQGIFPINIEYNSGINYFIAGAVDGMINTQYNELFVTLNSGLHITKDNLFYLRDFGINTPEEGLYCLSKDIKPEYLDFVEASKKGWNYAENHKEETLQVVYKYMLKDKIPINKALQRWILNQILILQRDDLDNENSKKSFTLNKKDYLDLCKILLNQGDITEIKPFDKFVYTK